MKPLLWNADKNKQLRAERGIDFDTAALAINQGLISISLSILTRRSTLLKEYLFLPLINTFTWFLS